MSFILTNCNSVYLDKLQFCSIFFCQYLRVSIDKSSKIYFENRKSTRAFIIYFAESYDPLWQARIDRAESDDINNLSDNSNKINSMPLYGLTNGFYFNKIGDYDLIIEYSPELWFSQGLIVSILSLAAMVVTIY